MCAICLHLIPGDSFWLVSVVPRTDVVVVGTEPHEHTLVSTEALRDWYIL